VERKREIGKVREDENKGKTKEKTGENEGRKMVSKRWF